MNIKFTSVSVLLLCLCVSQGQIIQASRVLAIQGSGRDLLTDRIEVGTRITGFALTDDSSSAQNSFLGTITHLEDNQDFSPYKIFANVIINSNLALELSWDKVDATTRTTDGKSDGDITMSGPIISIMGRYPLKNGMTPYAGIGVAVFASDFDETTHWGQGYKNPDDWIAAGSPSTPKGGQTRRMEMDDDTGLVLIAGVAYKLQNNWSVDAFIRRTDLEAGATFVSRVHGVETQRTHGSFPMDNIGMGLGVKYCF